MLHEIPHPQCFPLFCCCLTCCVPCLWSPLLLLLLRLDTQRRPTLTTATILFSNHIFIKNFHITQKWIEKLNQNHEHNVKKNLPNLSHQMMVQLFYVYIIVLRVRTRLLCVCMRSINEYLSLSMRWMNLAIYRQVYIVEHMLELAVEFYFYK